MNETAMRKRKLLEHFAITCHRNALGIWDCPDCAAIRSLIESSGDKASGPTETKCPTCFGKGIVYSDPDHRQLVCGDCEGTGENSASSPAPKRKENDNGQL